MSTEQEKSPLEVLKEKYLNKEWAKPEWTDLVLEQLADNEVSKDKNGKAFPRVRGLRRLGSYLADNVYIDCEHIFGNEQYASAKAIAFDSNGVVASAMAEATPANINNEMISKHLLATAESRAEGRCWTKVLKLNCLTAEEMSLGVAENVTKDNVKDIDDDDGSFMVPTQKRIINKKCKELDINPMKLAQNTCGNEKYGNLDIAKNIQKGELSKILASKLIERLDKASREEKTIPEEFKGYVAL